MIDITEAILYLVPDAKFVCWENDYNRIDWHPENTKPLPTWQELVDAWPTVEAQLQERAKVQVAKEAISNLQAEAVHNLIRYVAGEITKEQLLALCNEFKAKMTEITSSQ